jgi:hypothetical protein
LVVNALFAEGIKGLRLNSAILLLLEFIRKDFIQKNGNYFLPFMKNAEIAG